MCCPAKPILELGAGSGLWTDTSPSVLRGENPITAAVFNRDLADQAARRALPNTRRLTSTGSTNCRPRASTTSSARGSCATTRYAENLAALDRLLKPGGQLLFFEANYWNPQVFLKNTIRPIGRWTGDARVPDRDAQVRADEEASHQGLPMLEVVPYDIVHPLTPRRLIRAPAVGRVHPRARAGGGELCGTLYIWLVKPGRRARPHVNLAVSRSCSADSVVVPCHNEEMNVRPPDRCAAARTTPYIHEMIIVDDNGTRHRGGGRREAMKVRAAGTAVVGRRPTAWAVRSGTATPPRRDVMCLRWIATL